MNQLKSVWSWLAGKKTYIIAFGTIAYALFGWAMGYMDQDAAMQLLATGLAAAGLRHGLSK